MKKYYSFLAVLMIVFMIFAFSGCAKKNMTSAPNGNANNDTEQSGGNVESGNDVLTERKLIVTSTLVLETEDFDNTIKAINQACDEIGGYIERSSVQGKPTGDNKKRTASYSFRVPTDKLNEFKTAVKQTGNVINDDVVSNDVTGDYIDVEGRLKTAKLHRERLLELASNSGNLSDLVTLQKEIAIVETEIEQLTTSLNKWDSLVSLSTVKVDVKEVDKLTTTSGTFWSKITDTLSGSITFLITLIKGIALVLTALLPFIIIAVIILFIILYIRKRLKRKQSDIKKEKETS